MHLTDPPQRPVTPSRFPSAIRIPKHITPEHLKSSSDPDSPFPASEHDDSDSDSDSIDSLHNFSTISLPPRDRVEPPEPPSPTISPPPLADSAEIIQNLSTDSEDPDALDRSWLRVPRLNGGETDEESTVGSSLRASVMDDDFSSVSSEDHLSPYQTDNETAPLVEGSYVDAEATTSDSVIGSRRFGSPRGTHIRLIYPSVEASWSSSSATASDGATPGGSIANLGAPPHAVTINVDEEDIAPVRPIGGANTWITKTHASIVQAEKEMVISGESSIVATASVAAINEKEYDRKAALFDLVAKRNESLHVKLPRSVGKKW